MPPINPIPQRPQKPFAWDVEVEFSRSMVYCPNWQGNWRKTFHYKGSSEGAARTRAMLKPHARDVISTTPFATEAEYIKAYGNYWEKGF